MARKIDRDIYPIPPLIFTVSQILRNLALTLDSSRLSDALLYTSLLFRRITKVSNTF